MSSTTTEPSTATACVLCSKTLSSTSSLKRHLTTVHQLAVTVPTQDRHAVDDAPAPTQPEPAAVTEAETAPARRRTSKRSLIIGVAVVVVAGGLGIAKLGGGGGAATTVLHGHMALMQDTGLYSSSNYTSFDGSCEGTGGYNDLAEGSSVTIHDAAGTVIATGALEAGTSTASMCVFDWTISGVPKQKFYGVQISHRGTVTFSATDAADSLDTSIGG